jgi:uncharacterized protein involved in exopolysaccharide biosynthesis/Mrp family chromosome partitioning ATPase
MNQKQTAAPPPPMLGLDDIYHTLFRRKWVILGASLAGFIAAVVYYYRIPLRYDSVAELYVGYVKEAQPVDVNSSEEGAVKDPGGVILNSELNIIGSLDLARGVAETLGAASILPKGAPTNSVDVAALLIHNNLLAEVSPASQIIRLTFSHENPDMTRPVLNQLITNYIEKHTYIHIRTEEFNQYLNDKKDLLTMKVKEDGVQIAKAKSEGGILDVGSEMSALASQEARITEDNYLTLADLDEAMALTNQLWTQIPAVPVQAAPANAGPPGPAPPSADEQDEYLRTRQKLAVLQTKEDSLELTHTTNDILVKTNLEEIAVTRAKIKALTNATPGLVAAAESKAAGVAASQDPAVAFNDEVRKIARLQVRYARQTNELALLKAKGDRFLQVEVNIRELERNRAIDEEELVQTEKKVQIMAADIALGPNRVSNISIIEQPTPPTKEVLKTKKAVQIAGGGVAAGLALAFLLEMFLDRSLKRPKEAAKLGLPFFLSIPCLNGHGPLRLSKRGAAAKLLPAGAEVPGGGGAEGRALAPALEGPIAAWDEKSVLRPFHETLRDRLIAYFEIANLTHKPKLVALTSCHPGAGVSTLACGLASVMSETGEGNVLLVNMNSEHGDAHQFYKGKLNLGLDDLFETEKTDREHALVRENLYVVHESPNRDKLPGILPKRFSHLVAKMKASDYDYIIFDMPPVTQTSVTPRLARFMDMVLLVVEAEKTNSDLAHRAATLLSESRATMGVVMNKSRTYVPRRLHQEF